MLQPDSNHSAQIHRQFVLTNLACSGPALMPKFKDIIMVLTPSLMFIANWQQHVVSVHNLGCAPSLVGMYLSKLFSINFS